MIELALIILGAAIIVLGCVVYAYGIQIDNAHLNIAALSDDLRRAVEDRDIKWDDFLERQVRRL